MLASEERIRKNESSAQISIGGRVTRCWLLGPPRSMVRREMPGRTPDSYGLVVTSPGICLEMKENVVFRGSARTGTTECHPRAPRATTWPLRGSVPRGQLRTVASCRCPKTPQVIHSLVRVVSKRAPSAPPPGRHRSRLSQENLIDERLQGGCGGVLGGCPPAMLLIAYCGAPAPIREQPGRPADAPGSARKPIKSPVEF